MPYLAQKGHNCATAFPYIRVSHGLGAVQAHLHRFQEQPKTFRAYAKGMGKVPVEGHYQFEERAFSSLLSTTPKRTKASSRFLRLLRQSKAPSNRGR